MMTPVVNGVSRVVDVEADTPLLKHGGPDMAPNPPARGAF